MGKNERVQQERIKVLNPKEIKKGTYVLYWMQASQRAEYNHALEFAILKSNELRQPPINSQKQTRDITPSCWRG